MSVSLYEPVIPVNMIIGVLCGQAEVTHKAISVMQESFGAIDYKSETFPFTVTDYYSQEMGYCLKRLFVSFDELIDPSQIVQIKKETTAIEDSYRINGNRIINLDPGYMDYHKIVLASYKFGGYKIYLGQNVYGDMTLFYSKGRFIPFEWSFPDFKEGIYNKLFLNIRINYKKKLKAI